MNRERRSRTKTFTGCWTCRSRRVKCDQETPSCLRCRRFGVTCEGYGVRLSWLVIEGKDPDAHLNLPDDSAANGVLRPTPSRRTFGHSEAWLNSGLSSTEVDAMLERIDESPLGYSRTESVFSVFPAHMTARTYKEVTPEGLEPGSVHTCEGLNLELPSKPDDSPDLNALNSECGDQEFQDVRKDNDTRVCQSSEVFESANSTYHRHTGTDLSSFRPLSQAGEHEIFGIRDFQNTQIAADTYKTRYVVHECQPIIQQPQSHLDSLKVPASQRRLIHHWVTFTSKNLVLLDEPHNPMRTLMLPMALRGVMLSANVSSADVATFHAICACAAYNIFELGGRACEEDRALALKHDQQAIHHLRHNLSQADQHRDQSFAMAIMACITIEAISGNTQRWRAHVSGGLAYLGKLRSTGIDQDISSAFQAHMVSMAILCGCDVPAELKSFLQGASDLQLSFPYYGCSGSFLRSQDRMNDLATGMAHTDDRELDAFELQLYLDFPTEIKSDALPRMHVLMLQHMAQAFYYAALVFFQRSVRRVPVGVVQTLVEQGVKQLEAIESVSGGSAGCVMMWPALVLGAECGTSKLQDRMQSWFRKKRGLGFRNVVVLGDLTRNLWNRRARGDSQTRWEDLIVEDCYDVFRL